MLNFDQKGAISFYADADTHDLSNQVTDNYHYDAIGNLISDQETGISNVDWTVYGKIKTITKSSGNGPSINYTYEASGQRATKLVNDVTTWYVRDAGGNTMAIYDNKGGTTNWREQDLYGSSRLGMWSPNVNLADSNASTVWDTVGHKQYELTNHLGNVLATITDKRIPHSSDGTTIDYYNPETTTAQDYFAFGYQIPMRGYVLNKPYRYGFNGKENDNEVKKDFDGNDIPGAQQDYGMRIYDPRVGRFLSVDPLTPKYPELTPYQFGSNNPIEFIDLDGLEGTKPVQHGAFWTFIHNLRLEGDEFFGNLATKMQNTNAKQVTRTVNNTLNQAVNHPFNTYVAIDRDLSKQAKEGVLDGITLLYYQATKQDSKASKLGAKMVFKYGPMIALPEEREFELIQGVTRESEITAIAEFKPKFWNKSEEFYNIKVFQRDDIFDANETVSWMVNKKKVTGTNLERMLTGRAPIGIDGKPVNIHHLIQIDGAGVAEVTQTFHNEFSSILHINPNTIPSGIDRGLFDRWR